MSAATSAQTAGAPPAGVAPKGGAASLFAYEDFAGNFQAKTFVERLTANIFHEGDGGGGGGAGGAGGTGGGRTAASAGAGGELRVDPALFQQRFDASLERLRELRELSEARIQAHEEEVRRAEEAFKEHLRQAAKAHQSIVGRFRRLDQRLAKVSHTAVRVGQLLEQADSRWANSLRGAQVLQHFVDFNSGNLSRIDPIFTRSTASQLHRAAQLIQTLQVISEEVRVAGVEKAQALIAEKSQEIEQKLLERFEAAAAANDYDEMRQCAVTLCNFRGRSIVQRYIFNAMVALPAPVQIGADAGFAEIDAVLSRFFRDVANVCRKHVNDVVKVFPNPVQVLRSLIDRVFDERVLQFIDTCLSVRFARRLEYLEVLEMAFRRTTDLADELQKLIPRGSSAELEINLRDRVNGIFSRALEHYMRDELDLQRETASQLTRQVLAESKSQADAVVRGLVEAPAHGVDGTGGAGGGSERARSRRGREARQREAVLHATVWVEAALHSPLIDGLIQYQQRALRRCERLSEPNALADNVATLFGDMMVVIVEKYLMPIFSSLREALGPDDAAATGAAAASNSGGSGGGAAAAAAAPGGAASAAGASSSVMGGGGSLMSEPPSSLALRVSSLLDKQIQALERHYRCEVIARITGSVHTQNTLSMCESRKSESVLQIEREVLHALESHLRASVRWMAGLFDRERLVDYRVAEDAAGADLDVECSPVVSALSNYVAAEREAVMGARGPQPRHLPRGPGSPALLALCVPHQAVQCISLWRAPLDS
jgi:hypothetical protein